MTQKIMKYGRGHAIVLPKAVVTELGLEVGALVQVKVVDGRIVVCPVEVVPRLNPKDREFVDELYAQRRGVFDALAE